jgi:hypothetical protein
MTAFQVGLVLFAVLVGAVAAVATILIGCRGRRVERTARLPQGADAALWSIVEAIPDPRNHLALTRDLTGEVRVTGADRSLAALLATDRPVVDPLRAPRPGEGAPVARAEDERLSLAGSSLFSSTPDLRRF